MNLENIEICHTYTVYCCPKGLYSEIFRVGKHDMIPRMNDFIPMYLIFDFMELVLANIEIFHKMYIVVLRRTFWCQKTASK